MPVLGPVSAKLLRDHRDLRASFSSSFRATTFVIAGSHRRATTHGAAEGREARTEGTEPRRLTISRCAPHRAILECLNSWILEFSPQAPSTGSEIENRQP